MSLLIPVKKGLEEPVEIVGHKGLLLSHLEDSMKLSFNIIISSKLFKDFLLINNLTHLLEEEKKINSKEGILSLFQKATKAILEGSFPQSSIEDLKECFELVSLDTSNPNAKQIEILALRRSTDYVDEDNSIPPAKYTVNKFEEFLNAIKTCFLSIYTPTSIAQRLRQQIYSFNCAIVISRIPQMETCFESELSYHSNTIKINSYVGFFDPFNVIPKDSFVLSSEFLKILDRSIQRQNVVSVFDITTNSIKQQKFVAQGSSQSATDQLILEIGRLTKKISRQSSVGASLKTEFILNKQNQLVCLDVRFKQVNPNEHTSIKQTPKNIVENNPSNINIKQENSLDVSIKDNITESETKALIETIKTFLKANKNKSKFGPSIDIILRSLENETSKQSLIQAVSIVKEVINEWD